MTNLQVLPVLEINKVTNNRDVGEGSHLNISHWYSDFPGHNAVLPPPLGT